MSQDYVATQRTLLAGMQQLGQEMPDLMGGFATVHQTTKVDGAITAKNKELIALGISIAIRCEGCISCHVHDALHSGATTAEILEVIGVAVLMGGSPSVAYGLKARTAVDQFLAVGGVAS